MWVKLWLLLKQTISSKKDKYCIDTSLKMTCQNHQTDSALHTVDPPDGGSPVGGRPASGTPQQMLQ